MLLSSAKEANMTRTGANGWGLAGSSRPERGSPVHRKSGVACAFSLRASAVVLVCIVGLSGAVFAQALIPAMQAPTTQQNPAGSQPATTAPAQQSPTAPAQTPGQTPAPAEQTPAQPAAKPATCGF